MTPFTIMLIQYLLQLIPQSQIRIRRADSCHRRSDPGTVTNCTATAGMGTEKFIRSKRAPIGVILSNVRLNMHAHALASRNG